MKKNDGGYVLIYVVFVILFLCIIAVGTSTSALNNLKTQQAAVEQMQEKYAAESILEQFMAEVSAETLAGEGGEGTARAHLYNCVKGTADNNGLTINGPVSGDGVCEFSVSATVGTTQVNAKIGFTADIGVYSKEIKDENGVVVGTESTYSVTNIKSNYISYSVNSKADEEGGAVL